VTDAVSQALEAVAARIEQASFLDPAANVVADIAARAIPKGRPQDLAGGAFLGHPVHPMLVTVPIGAWLSATVLDLTGGNAKAAKRLVGLGALAAVPTAVTGANDWCRTTGAQRRVGFVHALTNDLALTAYTASWLARRRGHRVKGAALSLAGAGLLGAAGWLGGHLAYRMGVGVDTSRPL
jgi:uncharacterized membrane protein